MTTWAICVMYITAFSINLILNINCNGQIWHMMRVISCVIIDGLKIGLDIGRMLTQFIHGHRIIFTAAVRAVAKPMRWRKLYARLGWSYDTEERIALVTYLTFSTLWKSWSMLEGSIQKRRCIKFHSGVITDYLHLIVFILMCQ